MDFSWLTREEETPSSLGAVGVLIMVWPYEARITLKLTKFLELKINCLKSRKMAEFLRENAHFSSGNCIGLGRLKLKAPPVCFFTFTLTRSHLNRGRLQWF